MDRFMEQVVVNKKQTVNNLLFGLAWVTMIVMAILAVMFLNVLVIGVSEGAGFNFVVLAATLVTGAIAVYLFLRKDRLRTEFEYTFTNGDLDFAQVFNNRKRKTLGSLKVKNVDAFGPVSGEAFKKYLGMPGLRRNNWFLNREENLYFFYFQKAENKRMIILEPNEELVEMIRHYLPHGVYQE